MSTAALSAPAVERNREPILQVLRDTLPASGLVLEIASGTGGHAAWFSAALARNHVAADRPGSRGARPALPHGVTRPGSQTCCRR